MKKQKQKLKKLENRANTQTIVIYLAKLSTHTLNFFEHTKV